MLRRRGLCCCCGSSAGDRDGNNAWGGKDGVFKSKPKVAYKLQHDLRWQRIPTRADAPHHKHECLRYLVQGCGYTVCGVRTRTAAAARLSPLLHGEPSNRRRNCPARPVGSTHAAPTVPHYTERAEGAHSPTLIRKPPKNRISYFFGRLCRPVLCQLLPGALLCCC